MLPKYLVNILYSLDNVETIKSVFDSEERLFRDKIRKTILNPSYKVNIYNESICCILTLKWIRSPGIHNKQSGFEDYIKSYVEKVREEEADGIRSDNRNIHKLEHQIRMMTYRIETLKKRATPAPAAIIKSPNNDSTPLPPRNNL